MLIRRCGECKCFNRLPGNMRKNIGSCKIKIKVDDPMLSCVYDDDNCCDEFIPKLKEEAK